MTNPKDSLNQYGANANVSDNEHAAQHAANQHPNSHQEFFKNKKPVVSVLAEDEDPIEYAKRMAEEKQSVRRVGKLSSMVEDALINRVKEPSGDGIMRVTHDEFMRMKDDPHFRLFSQYMNLILNYANGAPRERPIRPFLENEVGMYKDQIVCLNNNPGDGARSGTFIPVGVQLQAEPDPFPSGPSFTIIKGGK